MKKLTLILLATMMITGLAACGTTEKESSAPVQESTISEQEVATDEFLEQIQGSYIELFPEFAKDEYHATWVKYVEPIVGAEKADENIDFLLDFCMAEIYGDEATAAYAIPENAHFNCYFLGGVDKFTVSGNTISGIDENGKEVFSHVYESVENAEDTGFLYYKTNDSDAGQFTYFAFCPDTPDTTYHLEFRYAENLDDLQSWVEGKYAYWNAAAISADYDDTMMEKCIELFATENLQ